jgi:hypothetical protein
VDYTTRPGESETEAHVNYKCPCGCDAGLIYERDEGPQHLGACCCGRLLWVGPQAAAVVRSHFARGATYEIEQSRLTLPWGETAVVALAVPLDAPPLDQEHHHDHAH